MPKIYHWRALFSAQGRYGRGEFWGVTIVLVLASLLLGGVAAVGPAVLKVVAGLSNIFVVVASVNNATKRLHDHGRSGWWQLLPGFFLGVGQVMAEETGNLLGVALTLVGALIWLVWLGFMPGQKTANRFGPPKSDTAPDRGDLAPTDEP